MDRADHLGPALVEERWTDTLTRWRYRYWPDHALGEILAKRWMETAIPVIVLLLTVVAIVGPGIFKIMVMIGLLTWTTPCRIIRAQFLSLREKEYVEAARCLGMTDFDIAIKHILPNAIAPLLVYASFGVATAVLLEAGLSYLGLGVQPPTPSWGGMISDAVNNGIYSVDPMYMIIPGLAIFITVMAFNLFGDGLRDALDPKSSR